jgi:prevent-host-death family protein
MKTMQLREAKAGLSAIVQAAEEGEPTIITKHGKPTAMVVPIDEARKLYPDQQQKNFVEHLMSFPGGIEFERDETPMRDIDL